MQRLLIALSLIMVGAIPAAAADKPNIVILVADDLGYNDVSFNVGQIPTPAIDRLANEGVRLNRFYASPVCSPSRAGLMTGRWPLRFGCMRSVIPPWRDHGMPPAEHTIAELAAEAGYAHRAVIGKWHLGHRRTKWHPTRQGFTHFYGHYNGALDYFTHKRGGEVDWHRNDETLHVEGYSTELLGAEAVRFIDARADAGDGPFMLYLPFNAPHAPFQALEQDLKTFPAMQGNRRVYAAMVVAMDRAVGRVLDALDAHHMTDNTFVLFFSDNGGLRKFSDNGTLRGTKFDMYEGGIRVCAAARWPRGGLVGGRDVDAGPIGYIDVYPTLKRIVGLADTPAPNPLDGVDVLDVMRGHADAPQRDWFSYLHQRGATEDWCIIRGEHKLIVRCGDILAPDARRKSQIELYDLAVDPREQRNIADANPKLVETLFARLREFRGWQTNAVPQYSRGRRGFTAPKDWIIRD